MRFTLELNAAGADSRDIEQVIEHPGKMLCVACDGRAGLFGLRL